jgi:DNA-binding LytR/AlgR family response regulator
LITNEAGVGQRLIPRGEGALPSRQYLGSLCPVAVVLRREQLLQQLSEQLAKLQGGGGRKEALRWIRAQAGKTLRLIAIDDVDYLRSDAKYTIVAWRDGGKPAEAVVRTPLKELLGQLDAEQFAQVHRSVVVNLRAISHVKRHDNETAEIHLTGRDDVLPVSRNYLHLFRQM